MDSEDGEMDEEITQAETLLLICNAKEGVF